MPEYKRFNCRPIDNADKRYSPEGMYYSNKLAAQFDFREFDGRPISLGYRLGVEYTYGTPMSVLPSFAERKR